MRLPKLLLNLCRKNKEVEADEDITFILKSYSKIIFKDFNSMLYFKDFYTAHILFVDISVIDLCNIFYY